MTLSVLRTGPSATVQDLGRPGLAHLGVPASGALDPAALGLANRLVGNPADAAGLEVVLGDLAFVAGRSLRLACTGAWMALTVDGRARPWAEQVSVPAGGVVELGLAPQGLRAWLAVDGGVDVVSVLGSRATDLLTGLGPPPLAAGDVIPLGSARTSPAAAAVVATSWVPARETVLPLLLGPRHDWFTEESVGGLFSRDFLVTPAGDRVGIRLEATDGRVLERLIADELPSEGIVSGSVQVPPSGQPLIFLADHPVTGGYPVVGVVPRPALAGCAQLRPGDLLRFSRA